MSGMCLAPGSCLHGVHIPAVGKPGRGLDCFVRAALLRMIWVFLEKHPRACVVAMLVTQSGSQPDKGLCAANLNLSPQKESFAVDFPFSEPIQVVGVSPEAHKP